MEIRANYVLVGVFTLSAMLGILFGILWLSKDTKKGALDLYDINFTESVSGLSIGNPVLFSGIRVGQVEDIKISETAPGAVKVRIVVRADTPVREDSRARLEMQGLTGSSAVAISGGTAASPLVNIAPGEAGIIQSQPSPLAAVMAEAPDTFAQARIVLENLQQILSPENKEKITEILSSTARLTTTLADNSGTMTEVFTATKDNLNELQALLRSTTRAVESIEKTVSALSPELKRTSSDTLPQFRILMAEMRNLVQTLSRITQKIDNNPRHFLFGNTTKEYLPE
jgi:ABC-type transport system involved in resistance to organic solvents, periplasmic component